VISADVDDSQQGETMNRITPSVCALALSLTLHAAAMAADGPAMSFLGEPALQTQTIFNGERFPNVVVTTDGTLVTTWGSSAMQVRRSTDGGVTWGSAITVGSGIHGGGVTVDEGTGDIMLFTHPTHPDRDGSTVPRTMYRSTDDGLSWQAETATYPADVNGFVPSLHMAEHGLTLAQGQHAGRLIRPARVYQETNGQRLGYNTAIYSDDGGQTWNPSAPFPEQGTGEGAIAELSDGRLYYNSRVHWEGAPQNTRRRSAWSYDGGATWEDWSVVDVLPDGRQDRSYGCMGGLVRLPVEGHDILVFSNLDTPNPTRERITVWASFDGGETWPVKRLVDAGPSGYSSLAAGRHGTPTEGWIYLQYEEGPGTAGKIARFNLSWLLDGEPTGDGTIPASIPEPTSAALLLIAVVSLLGRRSVIGRGSRRR
jgi:sialidase-1